MADPVDRGAWRTGSARRSSWRTLSTAAVRATLTEVLTDAAFERMEALAGRWTDGVAASWTRAAEALFA